MSDAMNARASNFSGPDSPTWELYSKCVHCGLCLNHCPTYRVLGVEMDSPRGRIRQVLDVDQGTLTIGKEFVTHIDRCLDCRACESVCPSGVHYGAIVERARTQIEQHYRRPLATRLLRNFFYGSVLKDAKKLARVARILRFTQTAGLQSAARKLGLTKLLGIGELDALSPTIDREFFEREIGQVFPADAPKRGTVAFHAGCIQRVAFAELDRATIRLLQRNGIEVHVPAGQGCCGALHAHAGRRDDARELARKNIGAIFDMPHSPNFDAIITNAAGCGSTMKEYDDLLEHDAEFRERATEWKRKMRDVSEYLAEIGLRPPNSKIPGRVAYQDACHLLHGQRISVQPRELLRAAGAELVELDHADQCCGSAGTYNITETELSMQLLDRKMRDVSAAAPDLIVTGNVGCQLQLRAGIARAKKQGRRDDIPVLHIVEVLERCYSADAESKHAAPAS